MALLRDEEDAEDKLIQTDISDADLERIMDRSDLIMERKGALPINPLPLEGPGWEVVIPSKSVGSMLSTVTS